MGKERKELPDNQVATQRNDLLHGQQSLSLIQKRIFALAIQQIKRDDDDLKTYTIQIQDLVAAGTSRNVFSKVEEETENLMRKILLKKEKIEGSRFPKTTRWSMVSKAIHHPGEGTLSIRIDPEIRDMLIQLKEQGNFTPVPVAELLACRSSYGQRIYELLYSQRWKGNRWEISVKDLRFSLNLENKYKNFSDFRRRILEKAQEDVRKHTNMRFTWEEESRGKGRKITHLIFEFEVTPDQINLPLEQPKTKKKYDFYNMRKRLKKYARLTEKEIDKFMSWIQKKTPEEQKAFAHNFNKEFETLIDTKTPVGNGKPITSPKEYFKAHYKEWIPG